ncbi:50S ribosomal protein L23 [Candidatus Poribacteria bacterium]|nr:50S ribosomal protein L23 [Candidatus Poribacteria bacterium]
MSKNPFDIIVRPIITESALAGQEGRKYTFEVALDANKKQIREAIQTAFGVQVSSVNTVRTRGHVVVRNRMRPGKKADVKKAIVTLAPGQALEMS